MVKLGNVKIYYTDMGKKKSVSGEAEDMGSFVKVKLKASKRRTKFDTVMLPWFNIIKVVVNG